VSSVRGKIFRPDKNRKTEKFYARKLKGLEMVCSHCKKEFEGKWIASMCYECSIHHLTKMKVSIDLALEKIQKRKDK
jgi:DNA-directed RNA polymerase subunit RPC12/RpoP